MKMKEQRDRDDRHLREMMARYGAPARFPVLNTEVGYDADKPTLGPEDLRLEHQAWHFVRQHLVDRMCDIRLTIWYNWNDDHGFRLVHGDMSALPVFNACRTMVDQLGGYRYVRRIETGSDLDYVLVFEKGPGQQKVVAWTTPQGRDDTPETARVHTVQIPAETATDAVVVCDVYGQSRPAAVIAGRVALALSGSPQYVEFAGGSKSANPAGTEGQMSPSR